MSVILVRPDGKVVIAQNVFGGPLVQKRVLRLTPDGALDPDFTPPDIAASELGAYSITALAFQGDKLIVGGNFQSISGVPLTGLARLNSDGSLDRSFQSPISLGANFGTGTFDFSINAIAVGPEGQLFVGGRFHQVNGQPRVHLARFEANGALDPNFVSPINTVGAAQVQALLAEPEGSVLAAGPFLAGDFPTFNTSGLVRVLPNGAIDPRLKPPGNFFGGALAVAKTAEDKILVATEFSSLKPLTRLLPSGVVDPDFDIGDGPDDRIFTLAMQPDGRILVGGSFRHWSHQPRQGVVRLLPEGAVDPTFDSSAGPDPGVTCLAVQPPGRVIVGGYFRAVEGRRYSSLLGLLTEDPPPTPPALLGQTEGVSLSEGENLFLRVDFVGFPRFFQWFKDGVPIPGADQEALAILGVTTAEAGTYQLRITNALGSVTTPPIAAAITPRPTGPNLLRNASFEDVRATPTDPFAPPPDVIADWTWTNSIMVHRFPADAPINVRGYEDVLEGTNYVSLSALLFSYVDGQSPSDYSGALSSRLAAPTIPGRRYELEVPFSLGDLSFTPTTAFEVVLFNSAGAGIVLGTQTTTNALGWQRLRRTFVASEAYDQIRLRPVLPPGQSMNSSTLFLDDLALRATPDLSPALAPIPTQVISSWEQLQISLRVTETDVTDHALRFELSGTPPRSASLDPERGWLRWSPTDREAGTTNKILVIATYLGSPAAPSTNEVTVVVPEAVVLTVGESWARAGDRARVPLSAQFLAQPGHRLTGLSFELVSPSLALANFAMDSLADTVASASVTALEPGRIRVTLQAKPDQGFTGQLTVGQMTFDTAGTATSGRYELRAAFIAATTAEGASVPASRAFGGRLGLVQREPLLAAAPQAGVRTLRLYGLPGTRYRIEQSSSLTPPIAWQAWRELMVDAFPQEIPVSDTEAPVLFLRAVEIP